MKYDIVGFGAAAHDTILEVEHYPYSGGKTRVLSREVHGGGLTTTALVAASKLGVTCWYGGSLGDNATSHFLRQELEHYGVAVVGPEKYGSKAEPIISVVVLEKGNGNRTIFWSDADVVEPIVDAESRQIALSAKVFFADQMYAKTLLSLYQEVRSSGIPLVGDFEAIRSQVEKDAFMLIDHPILPAHFACEYASTMNIEESVKLILREPTRKAVVVTDGENGCWFAEPGDETVRHQPAFSVSALDTTGCGDVFHGACAAALVRGWDVSKRVRFASASAALKATRKGGQVGAPTLEEVEKFLAIAR
ncbi:MAG: PfkB family carbohydrate kinase [Thermoguttaceae bacterium]